MDRSIELGLVSTIIPVFNRPKMVVEAIQSVLAQDYRPIELIVVDDGSTDDTAIVLAEMENKHPEIIFLQQENSGPGAARELGRQSAAGEFIQYLDSDDLLLASKFSKQVSALRTQVDCDVAYGRTQLLINGVLHYEAGWKRTGEKIDLMFPSFLNQRWWGTSTPLYRRKVIDQAGVWGNFINEEDWEYDCRIAAMGTRLAYVDEVVSQQRRHDQHLSEYGTTDPVKLKHRCQARQKIYQSAIGSTIAIPESEMQFFSKAIFLLARECAAAGLAECVNDMLRLSGIAAKNSRFKQWLFQVMGKCVGWRNAAKIVTAFGY